MLKLPLRYSESLIYLIWSYMQTLLDCSLKMTTVTIEVNSCARTVQQDLRLCRALYFLAIHVTSCAWPSVSVSMDSPTSINSLIYNVVLVIDGES